jgi:PAS domain S-box-containing protein
MPLGTGSGVSGVVTTYADVTASTHARNLLRRSEERFRGLIESLPVALLEADPSMRVTYANPAWTTLTGYEVSEVAEPAAWSRIIHPDDLPRLLNLAAEALAGQTSRGEFRYQAKDGSDKVGFAITQPRWQNGAVIGTLTLILNLTRERQLEKELQRSQGLELVGRLSSGTAHDFNNFLTVILSLADLARSTLPPDHAARADLDGIIDAAGQASDLAQQLMSFGKPRRGTACRLEVNRLVRRTLELVRASLPAGANLQADLAAEELHVLGDETQLRQVLVNLCLNARDAVTDLGPKGCVTVQTVHEQGGVGLAVEDNGVGMDEKTRARLFDPFFSTKEHGTSLGLTVVRQIVESHGGRIEVTSQLGQGTRFHIWWPACPDGEPASQGLVGLAAAI